MSNYLIEHRVRIRNRADNADLLVASSVRGDTLPYLKEPPSGDGQGFNPLTNTMMAGSYTARIVDAITSGTSRVLTSQLEDVNARLQLGYLKTYIGWRRDGGSWNETFGFLTGVRLISDVEGELTIQDPSILYDGFELFNATSSTTISSFLGTWPNRGCLLGGPIKGSWLNIPDLGGWTMRVRRITSLGHLRYWLEPISVYGPGSWIPGQTTKITPEFGAPINAAVRSLPKGNFEFNTVAVSTIADAYSRSFWWTGLVLLIDGAVFRPIPPFAADHHYGSSSDGKTNYDANGDSFSDLVSVRGGRLGLFAYDDGQGLADGAVIRVRALTVLPSELSPILLDRHPVDHLTDCLTLAGLSYNAAGCTALKELIGTELRHAMIIKGSRRMGEHLREAAFQLGIATRTNSAGEIVPFSTRIFNNSVPTKTITDALVVQGTTKAFDLDVAEGLQRVTLRQKTFSPINGAGVYGVAEGELELTLNNGFANPAATGVVEIVTDGMLRPSASSFAPPDLKWLAAIADPLFDRFGAGCQAFETDMLRGDGTTDADTANLGDEYLVNVKQIPNHNKRYGDDASVGARALQFVRITEMVDRRRALLKDSGPNAQALATKPTHTIAASSDLPRTVAELTITNAAALNALAYAVVIQVAVTTGAAPATTDYVDAYRSVAAAIPTGAIRLPSVVAGRKVYARARSEKSGSRPSDWSTGVSVVLTAVAPVTGLTATKVVADGSQEDLAWTVGVSDCHLDVYLRASGAAFSTADKRATLLPGSTRYRLTGLTPNSAYTATIQHRDSTTQDVSAVTEVTFTTATATYKLLAPIFPDAFSFPVHVPGRAQGRDLVDYAARYGIAVVAQEFPGLVEIAEAVETAVGAGTYGAYTEQLGRVPAISGDYTIWSKLAPQDGLRRKLKARSVGDGQTSSDYCAEVVVNPATVDQIETFPLSIKNFKEKTRASTTITVQWENAGTALEIWIYTVLKAQPVTSDSWPSISDAPTIRLTPDTTEYTFDIPDQNSILYGVIVPIGPGSGEMVPGIPWRFTLQPSTQQRIIQRAKILSSTPQSCVVRVEVANPIAGGDVTISYVSNGLTVSPASPQTVLAANVPTDLTNPGALVNYVDFTVTRPAPGANDRVTFTAASTDRTSDIDAVDIPALDGIPQGSVAIDSTGQPTVEIDGAAWVASYKWKADTSDFPSEATVLASGTTTNGRQIAVSAGSALGLGSTVYVTIIPFSQASAAGVQGASVRLKATRHDFSATKTVRFAATTLMWDAAASGSTPDIITGYVSVGHSNDTSNCYATWQGPNGATITKVEAELYTNAGGLTGASVSKIELFRVSATGGQTSIGNVQSSNHNAWETKNFTCSEDTTGRQYQLNWYGTVPGVIGTDPGSRIAAWYVTYSMPTSTVAL